MSCRWLSCRKKSLAGQADDLALHPWYESIDMLLTEAESAGIKILTPQMGEKLIPGISQTGKWWKKLAIDKK